MTNKKTIVLGAFLAVIGLLVAPARASQTAVSSGSATAIPFIAAPPVSGQATIIKSLRFCNDWISVSGSTFPFGACIKLLDANSTTRAVLCAEAQSCVDLPHDATSLTGNNGVGAYFGEVLSSTMAFTVSASTPSSSFYISGTYDYQRLR